MEKLAPVESLTIGEFPEKIRGGKSENVQITN
jgi:hypothetical protein